MRAAAAFLFSILFGIIFGGSAFPQSVKADLVILNGDVWTMNEKQPRAEAVAVFGGRIIAVGSNDEIKKLAGETTKTIDVKGNTVLPGFNDAHVHFMAIGNTFSSLDLKGITKADEFYARIRHYVRFLPKGRWIMGSGGIDELWEQIDGTALDKISPDNPVLIYHQDAKSAITNSAALSVANIRAATVGVIRSTEFERLIKFVPADHMRRWDEIAETASNYAASLGVTSVQDMHSDDQTAIYRELERQGKLKTRVYDCSSLSGWAKDKKPFKKSDTPMVRGGCLKGFHESDEDWTPKLRADILAADKAGLHIAIHAIGDRATGRVLEIFDEAIRVNGKRDRRFRIEHAERISAANVRKYGKPGIVASIQPYLFGGGAGYASGYYSELERSGFKMAVGSDAPMIGFDPMLAVMSGLRSKETAKGELLLEKTIRGHTLGSAYAEFQDDVKGSIQPGKLADLVILKTDLRQLLKLDNEKTTGLLDKVMITIVDGKVVYQADL